MEVWKADVSKDLGKTLGGCGKFNLPGRLFVFGCISDQVKSPKQGNNLKVGKLLPCCARWSTRTGFQANRSRFVHVAESTGMDRVFTLAKTIRRLCFMGWLPSLSFALRRRQCEEQAPRHGGWRDPTDPTGY